MTKPILAADDTLRIPSSLCPHCGYRLNAAGSVLTRLPLPQPRPGDLTVCVGCGEVAEFGPLPRLRLQRVPARVLAALSIEERAELAAVQTVVRGFIATHPADDTTDAQHDQRQATE